MRNAAGSGFPHRANALPARTPEGAGLFAEMFGKKSQATRPRDFGALFVVACSFVAVKSVLRARIDVNFELGPLGPDHVDVAERNAGVLVAEV